MHKPPCRPRPKCARHTARAKSRILIVQFQNISDTSVNYLRDGKGETVFWPNRYKAGDVILPYSNIMHCGQGARDRNAGGWSSAWAIANKEQTGASCSRAAAADTIATNNAHDGSGRRECTLRGETRWRLPGCRP